MENVSAYNPEVFTATYDKIKAMIVNRTFSASNWITLVTLAMEVVEALPNLKGIEKRNLVVDLVTRLVSEIPMPQQDRELVAALLHSALPSIIDAIVQGTLGQLAVNAVEQAHEGAKRCFAKCGGKA